MIRQLSAEGKDPEQTWFRLTKHDPITREVTSESVHIPQNIMESTEDVAKGKAAHDAGHVAITRMGEFIPPEVLKQPGFLGTHVHISQGQTPELLAASKFEVVGITADNGYIIQFDGKKCVVCDEEDDELFRLEYSL